MKQLFLLLVVLIIAGCAAVTIADCGDCRGPVRRPVPPTEVGDVRVAPTATPTDLPTPSHIQETVTPTPYNISPVATPTPTKVTRPVEKSTLTPTPTPTLYDP